MPALQPVAGGADDVDRSGTRLRAGQELELVGSSLAQVLGARQKDLFALKLVFRHRRKMIRAFSPSQHTPVMIEMSVVVTMR